METTYKTLSIQRNLEMEVEEAKGQRAIRLGIFILVATICIAAEIGILRHGMFSDKKVTATICTIAIVIVFLIFYLMAEKNYKQAKQNLEQPQNEISE